MYIYLCERLPNYCTKWLYHFTFPPAKFQRLCILSSPWYFSLFFFFIMIKKAQHKVLSLSPFLSVQLSSVEHIHVIVQPISCTFSSYKTETPYPLNSNSLPSFSSLWQPLFYFCLYDSDHSRYII